MNQQLNRRFSQFENVKFFYDFYLQRINWLRENFFNRKIYEFIIFRKTVLHVCNQEMSTKSVALRGCY